MAASWWRIVAAWRRLWQRLVADTGQLRPRRRPDRVTPTGGPPAHWLAYLRRRAPDLTLPLPTFRAGSAESGRAILPPSRAEDPPRARPDPRNRRLPVPGPVATGVRRARHRLSALTSPLLTRRSVPPGGVGHAGLAQSVRTGGQLRPEKAQADLAPEALRSAAARPEPGLTSGPARPKRGRRPPRPEARQIGRAARPGPRQTGRAARPEPTTAGRHDSLATWPALESPSPTQWDGPFAPPPETPATKQSPATRQSPVTRQSPATRQSPVTRQPPATRQSPVTEPWWGRAWEEGPEPAARQQFPSLPALDVVARSAVKATEDWWPALPEPVSETDDWQSIVRRQAHLMDLAREQQGP